MDKLALSLARIAHGIREGGKRQGQYSAISVVAHAADTFIVQGDTV